MCGLVGVCGSTLKTRDLLVLARDTLAHRGPDHAGEWWSRDGQVGLGHRRLSILDLSSAGNQPMSIPEMGLSIVFNGEVYNFKEIRAELEKYDSNIYHPKNTKNQKRIGASIGSKNWNGSSDTEVLLAAYSKWGTDCLKHLNGMFAFAIYDEKKRQLFLARDRAGEKPLFYRIESEKLWFASELKALIAVPGLPRKIDPEALDCYLAFGYVPGEMCILEGYHKLPPAHAMTFDLDRGTHWIWQWWRPPPYEAEGGRGQVGEAQLIDDLESLLEDAVARQMVADVPVGILLSGGVDSSLVTAMAIRTSNKVSTFTIGFPGAGRLDETEHARLIAGHFGTNHTELVAEPASAELIPLLARQFDEPMVDSSMIPTFLVSRLVRKYCKVALGGDGGDELFAGYDHYQRMLWMERRLGLIPGWLRKVVSQSAERFLPSGLKGRNYLQGLGADPNKELPILGGHFDRVGRAKLLSKEYKRSLLAEEVWRSRTPLQKDLLQRVTRMDFSNYLAEDILVKVDRASMLNSLEVRAPLLDYRIIEFAFGKVPSHFKATETNKKILLKGLAARVLPKEFDKQRKQGFSIPLADWLKKGPFRDLFWETLSSTDCLFDASTVKGLLKGQDAGYCNSERLFALVLFTLWCKAYGAKL